MKRALFLMLSLVMGCSGTERPPVETPAIEESAPSVDAAPEEPPPSGPRAISQPATFGDLVQAASVLDERGEGGSSSECLLSRPSRRGWPWMLDADVASSVRPIPAAPDDLDARLVRTGQPVLVVSRWGQIGVRSYDIALASITSAPPLPGQPSAVLLLTGRGYYLRSTDRRISAGRISPRPIPARGSRIEEIEEGSLVFVTAEAGVLLDDLRRLLAALPDNTPVSLCVALEADIRIPDPPEPPVERDTGMCPDGLPPPSEELPAGGLDRTLLVGALGPLRDRARLCLESAAGTRAAGGRVEVMMRIGAEGRVVDACLRTDELGGTEMRHCLIEAARATRFPVPRPAGHVDVSLPLRLMPSYQQAICAP